MGRLIFTKEAGNNENKFIVGTTVGRQSKFVRSTLKRRASNNSQGLCCDSAPTKVEPLPESDVASIEIEDIAYLVREEKIQEEAIDDLAKENIMILKLKDGDVIIRLYKDVAPNHVERIKELADGGKYDNVIFHRVIDGFLAQTGDVQFGNSSNVDFDLRRAGNGNSDLPNLKEEFSNVSHERGTLSMASTSAPDSANSQFFILFQQAHFLDGQYTVFGKVIEGMEFVDKIKRGEPALNPDKIISFKSLNPPLAVWYRVTVENYLGKNKFFINDKIQDNLTLNKNVIHIFDQSDTTNESHPLKFSITPNGTHDNGSEYTDEVNIIGIPGTRDSYTFITVGLNTPSLLYFFCPNHSEMGGKITILTI